MSPSTTSLLHALAKEVWFDEHVMRVHLVDGREIAVPLGWFPSLRQAGGEQRNEWRLIGNGEGIHWPQLDEELSVAGLLEARSPRLLPLHLRLCNADDVYRFISLPQPVMWRRNLLRSS